QLLVEVLLSGLVCCFAQHQPHGWLLKLCELHDCSGCTRWVTGWVRYPRAVFLAAFSCRISVDVHRLDRLLDRAGEEVGSERAGLYQGDSDPKRCELLSQGLE